MEEVYNLISNNYPLILLGLIVTIILLLSISFVFVGGYFVVQSLYVSIEETKKFLFNVLAGATGGLVIALLLTLMEDGFTLYEFVIDISLSVLVIGIMCWIVQVFFKGIKNLKLKKNKKNKVNLNY